MRLTCYCKGVVLGLALLVPGIAWGGEQKTIVNPSFVFPSTGSGPPIDDVADTS